MDHPTWCGKPMPHWKFGARGLQLDFGCADNKVGPDFIGIDLHAPEADINADIRRPIPDLPDGCASHVICRHVLEHLAADQWRDVMRELARVLEPGGTFEIRVPHPSDEDAMIHGHLHVLTPLFWRRMQDSDGKIEGLTILTVQEIYNPVAVADHEAGRLPFEELEMCARYLRNMFTETVVTGIKPR